MFIHPHIYHFNESGINRTQATFRRLARRARIETYCIYSGVLALLNIVAGAFVISRLPTPHSAGVWLWVAVFYVIQLSGPFGDRLFFANRRRKHTGLIRAIDWVSYLAFGAMSCLVLYGLATEVITLIWRLAAPPADEAAFNRGTLLALGLVTAVTVVIGIVQALMPPKIQRVDRPLASLPTAFDGFTIAQVSDLHVGPTIGRATAQRVADIVNGLGPDVIALTADFVDGTVSDLAYDVAPLASLRAKHGVFFVTGNHEYFWDAGEWIAAFTRLGARVLVNEHVIIRRSDAALVMAGITDYSTRHMPSEHASNPKRALADAPADAVKILLAHQPASYTAAAEAGADLQLSGHTHAGQYFPFSLLIGFFQTFTRGLNRHGKIWIYVNQGTGYWGPPMRTGVPAEITLLTLRTA